MGEPNQEGTGPDISTEGSGVAEVRSDTTQEPVKKRTRRTKAALAAESHREALLQQVEALVTAQHNEEIAKWKARAHKAEAVIAAIRKAIDSVPQDASPLVPNPLGFGEIAVSPAVAKKVQQTDPLLIDITTDPTAVAILEKWVSHGYGAAQPELYAYLDKLGCSEEAMVVGGKLPEKNNGQHSACLGMLNECKFYNSGVPREQQMIKDRLVALFGDF